jgi:tetratricopeptide (TPR) repeat protein
MAVALRGLPTPRTDDALRQIRHAIELSPNSYRYYTILGALLYEKDRPRDALDAYRKGLAIAPDDFMLLNNEAVQLGNLGRQAEEFEAWVKLVRKNPRRTTGYTGLALSMQKTKRYSDAVPLLRAGIPHFGRDPFLYGLLGEGEGALEHSAVAGECFRKMIDNASSQAVRAEGWLYLGVSEAKRNNWREAIDSYSMALALEPNRTQARYLLAEAYRMSGRVGEAKRFYSQVVRLDPKGYWGKGAAWNLQKLNEAQ